MKTTQWTHIVTLLRFLGHPFVHAAAPELSLLGDMLSNWCRGSVSCRSNDEVGDDDGVGDDGVFHCNNLSVL